MDQKREIEFEPLFGARQHPDPNVDLVYELIESATADLMRILKENVPEGRELANAKTYLETAALWALAGIARQKPYEPVLSSAPGG